MAAILYSAFSWLIYIISTLIFVQVIISWIPPLAQSHVGRIIAALTEPVLAPIRQGLMRIPALRQLPVDFSPIAAWILLGVVQRLSALLYAAFA